MNAAATDPTVAILLCAGYGTRMGALGERTPKPLLEVGERPLLDHLVEQLVGLDALDAIHVVTNSLHADRFRAWADAWARLPACPPITLHDDGTASPAERLGAVGDLAFVLERVAPPGAALVGAGDNVPLFSLEPFWNAFRANGRSRVLALEENDVDELRRTGVLEIDDGGRVVRLHEKPAKPPSNRACPPIYALAGEDLAEVAAYLERGGEHDEIGRFIGALAERRAVFAHPQSGERLHVGTAEALRRADERLTLAGADMDAGSTGNKGRTATFLSMTDDVNKEETLLPATTTAIEDPLPAPSNDLEQIFQQHHRRIFGTAFRVTGRCEDAEDVLQTVFLRLLRRQNDLDLSPNPKSYLYRAAVNASLDLLRRHSRKGAVPFDQIDPPATGGDLDPERRQQDRELRRELRQAMLKLSPKGAQIFGMRFLDGTPNREIAESMGMTQTAVGVALHRARNQVKQDIRAFVGGDPDAQES